MGADWNAMAGLFHPAPAAEKVSPAASPPRERHGGVRLPPIHQPQPKARKAKDGKAAGDRLSPRDACAGGVLGQFAAMVGAHFPQLSLPEPRGAARQLMSIKKKRGRRRRAPVEIDALDGRPGANGGDVCQPPWCPSTRAPSALMQKRSSLPVAISPRTSNATGGISPRDCHREREPPVLDFSFQDLRCCTELTEAEPRGEVPLLPKHLKEQVVSDRAQQELQDSLASPTTRLRRASLRQQQQRRQSQQQQQQAERARERGEEEDGGGRAGDAAQQAGSDGGGSPQPAGALRIIRAKAVVDGVEQRAAYAIRDDAQMELRRIRKELATMVLEDGAEALRFLRYRATRMRVAGNMLRDASPLAHTVSCINWGGPASITTLDLSQNFLARVPDSLLEFASLRVLYLQANRIASIAEVAKLRALEDLRVLTVHGNPIEIDPLYKWKMITALPQLRRLDSSAITAHEREVGRIALLRRAPPPLDGAMVPELPKWGATARESAAGDAPDGGRRGASPPRRARDDDTD